MTEKNGWSSSKSIKEIYQSIEQMRKILCHCLSEPNEDLGDFSFAD